MRWAKERSGQFAVVNAYELDTAGLNIFHLDRDAAWLDYIFSNRAGGADALAEADVITGPVANDTIYNTLGIITSGILSREEALRLLMIGPAYSQTVIKSERAAAQLRWVSARKLDGAELSACRAMAAWEEKEYQTALALALGTV